jgi:hypothetical protein
MKKPALAAALAMLLAAAAPAASAAENPYDLFAQTIAPFIDLFAGDGRNKTMTLEVRIVSAVGLNPKLPGVRATIALGMPDRFSLTAITRDDVVTLCRDGQKAWVAPGGPAREIIGKLAPGLLTAKEDAAAHLADFALPIPRKQLVLLPVLFAIDDIGDQEIAGESCRVIDVRLMPELAQSLKTEHWVARLWITSTRIPRRIQLQRGRTAVLVAIDELAFPPAFPDSTWAPAAAGDVIELNATQVELLIKRLFGYFK